MEVTLPESHMSDDVLSYQPPDTVLSYQPPDTVLSYQPPDNVSPTTLCNSETAEAMYMYTCSDANMQKTEKSFVTGCELKDPVRGVLLDDIKRDAYMKMNRGDITGYDELNMSCDIAPIPLRRSNQDEWLKRGIASSCAPNYNTNEARIINDYRCNYNGTMIDSNGNLGTFPSKQINGRIFSCDLAPLTSDELMNDVRRSAYYKLGGSKYMIDPNKFSCSVFTFPL